MNLRECKAISIRNRREHHAFYRFVDVGILLELPVRLDAVPIVLLLRTDEWLAQLIPKQ
jgi:hypothetical protein